MRTAAALCLAFALAVSAFAADLPPACNLSAVMPPSKDTVAFETALQAFLRRRCYDKLGWTHDPFIRDTGPYILGDYYGTHPAVRIWYSPEVAKWMKLTGGAAGRHAHRRQRHHRQRDVQRAGEVLPDAAGSSARGLLSAPFRSREAAMVVHPRRVPMVDGHGARGEGVVRRLVLERLLRAVSAKVPLPSRRTWEIRRTRPPASGTTASTVTPPRHRTRPTPRCATSRERTPSRISTSC